MNLDEGQHRSSVVSKQIRMVAAKKSVAHLERVVRKLDAAKNSITDWGGFDCIRAFGTSKSLANVGWDMIMDMKGLGAMKKCIIKVVWTF